MRYRLALCSLLALFCHLQIALRGVAQETPVPNNELAPVPATEPTVDSFLLEGTPVYYGRPPCGPPGRIWLRSEVLAWWLSGSGLPPLVTASPDGTAQGQAGVLGAPGTTVLFGNERVNNDIRAGGRINTGFWLDQEQVWGFEYTLLFVERQSAGFQGLSSGSPVLARPFVNANTGANSSELVAFPGVTAGGVSADAASGALLGHEFLLRQNLCCYPGWRMDALAGIRYLRYTEGLSVVENLSPNGPLDVPGTNILVIDDFQTRNEFLGAEIGLTGEIYRDRWFFDWRTTFSLGETAETLGISGATVVTVPGTGNGQAINPGGLLALQSNIGRYRKGRVAVVPEIGFHIGRQVTDWMRVRFGYTLIYWSDIIRAGDQIDLGVNPNLLPPVATPVVGPARPALTSLRYSDLFAQGLDFGLELRY